MTDMPYTKSDPQILAQMKQAFLDRLDPENCWVFAYGSLLWDPGFEPETSIPIKIDGWQRSFCVYSYHYRGTEECPGLILGLDKGGECEGLALKVPAAQMHEIMSILWDREMISGIYDPHHWDVLIETKPCHLYAFVIDRHNPQYAGEHNANEAARIIASAHGSRGPNRDYVINTYTILKEHHVEDREMAAIVEALDQF